MFAPYPGSQSLSGHGDLPHPFSQVCSACHILHGHFVPSRLYWQVMLQWMTSHTCISLLLVWGLQRKFLEMEFLGQKVKKICRHNFIRFCHISLHRVVAFCVHMRVPFLYRFVTNSLLRFYIWPTRYTVGDVQQLFNWRGPSLYFSFVNYLLISFAHFFSIGF